MRGIQGRGWSDSRRRWGVSLSCYRDEPSQPYTEVPLQVKGISRGQGRRRSVDLWFFRPNPRFCLTWTKVEFVRWQMGIHVPASPSVSPNIPVCCGVHVGLTERAGRLSAVVRANEFEASCRAHKCRCVRVGLASLAVCGLCVWD